MKIFGVNIYQKSNLHYPFLSLRGLRKGFRRERLKTDAFMKIDFAPSQEALVALSCPGMIYLSVYSWFSHRGRVEGEGNSGSSYRVNARTVSGMKWRKDVKGQPDVMNRGMWHIACYIPGHPKPKTRRGIGYA